MKFKFVFKCFKIMVFYFLETIEKLKKHFKFNQI